LEFQEILKFFLVLRINESTNREKILSEDIWNYLDFENKNSVSIKNIKSLMEVLLCYENSTKIHQENEYSQLKKSFHENFETKSYQTNCFKKGIFDSNGLLLLTNYEKAYLRLKFKELVYNRLAAKRCSNNIKSSDELSINNDSKKVNSKKIKEIHKNKSSDKFKIKIDTEKKGDNFLISSRNEKQKDENTRYNKTFINNLYNNSLFEKSDSEMKNKSFLNEKFFSKLAIPKIKNALITSDALDFKSNIINYSFSPQRSKEVPLFKRHHHLIVNEEKEIERMARGRSMKKEKNEELLFTKKGSTSIKLYHEIKSYKQGFNHYMIS